MDNYSRFVYPNPAITQVIDSQVRSVTLAGGTPVLALEGDANRIRVILVCYHNATFTVVIGPLNGSDIFNLATASLEQGTAVLRVEDYGELIKRPLYVREVNGGAAQCTVSLVRYTNPTLLI